MLMVVGTAEFKVSGWVPLRPADKPPVRKETRDSLLRRAKRMAAQSARRNFCQSVRNKLSPLHICVCMNVCTAASLPACYRC